MIAYKQKKTKKKRVLSSGQLTTDVIASEMGLKSINSSSTLDPDYIKELVNDIRKFSHMLLYLKEAILSGLSSVFSWHPHWIVCKMLNGSLAAHECVHSGRVGYSALGILWVHVLFCFVCQLFEVFSVNYFIIRYSAIHNRNIGQ